MTSVRNMKKLPLANLLALGLIAASVASCAGQGDVDRTQPDRIDKSIFFNADGTSKVFYYRQTYVGAPPTSNWVFEGSQGTMEKVRFAIKEDTLLGYRAYDYAPGSQNGFTSTANNNDSPILLYPIVSHFDVKREYNAATGEQTNVISENTTDRPWHERQYMRVNWSVNIAAEETSMSFDPTMSFFSTTRVPVNTWLSETAYSDPEFGNRPIVTADYIDFIQKETRTPDYLACSKLYPFVDDGGPWNCGPAELQVRNSFLAVKPSTYQPLDYPDNYQVTDATGKQIEVLPNGSRCTADQIANAGGLYSGDDCAPAQAPAFKKFGFFRTVVQTYDRKYGATEAGREYFANRWNIWDNVDMMGGKVIMDDGKVRDVPLNLRRPKPIVFYTNVEFPNDDPTILGEATEVTKDWSDAFKRTIAGMLLTEGNPNMTVKPDELAAKAAGLMDPDDPMKPLEMVVLKKNSCNLPDVKTYLGTHAELATFVQEAAGVTSDTVDSKHLTQVCSILEAKTQTLADVDKDKFTWQRNGDLRYSFVHWVDRPAPAGPLGYGPSSADPQTGEIVSASLYLYGAALDTYAQFAADSIGLLNNNISTDDLLSGKTITDVLKATATASAERNAKALTPEALARARALVTRGGTTPTGVARLLPVPGGRTASKLSLIKGTALERELMTPDILAAFLPESKPGDTLSPDQIAKASPVNFLTPEGRDARAERFNKFATNGCVFLGEFADDAIAGLALELNNAGLKGDELFKELRKRIFRGLADHEMGHTMGLRHNFAGSTDALNYNDQFWKLRAMFPSDTKASDLQARSNAKIQEYEYSTVMDYGARFNSDINGLGKYDLAAIRFGYGGLVDVMSPAATNAPGTADAPPYDYESFVFAMDYKKLPARAGGWQNLADGGVRRYTSIRATIQDYYAQTDKKTPGFPATDERPFKFCSDEFVGSLDCKAWDFGANQQEIVSDTIDRYKNYFVFNAFKRGRLNWSINGYFTRLLDRYFSRFTEAYQFYYFFGGLNPQQYDLPADLLKASVDSLNALGEILQTPEPGEHCPTTANPNLYVLPSTTGTNTCKPGAPSMTIGVPEGKPYYINFSNDYYYRITRAGSLYEKLAALYALTSTQARFYRVDTFADSSKFAINYYSTFKDEMLNLVSGVIRDDASSYGGQAVSRQYQPTPVVDLDIWGVAKPTLPDYLRPDALRVATPVNKTIRSYALWLSLGNLDTTWDSTLDISNYMAVAIKGSKEDVTYPTATTMVEFQHPQSGLIYRAPLFDPAHPGIGAQVVQELRDYTGVAGTAGALPPKFGTFKDKPLPDWQTAKTALDAAQMAAQVNTDKTMTNTLQQNYQDALSVFEAVDSIISFRVDVLSDLRSFRNFFSN
jgi:hypothetical protein